jgi:hypothetical protein
MPPLSHVKLTRLAQLEGFRTKEALLHTYIREITVPGIGLVRITRWPGSEVRVG